jgi:hypothetical protein
MSSGRIQNGKLLVTENNIQKEVKRYKKSKNNRTWSSFEEFCDYQTRLWEISFVENWLSSTCNWSQNQKLCL